MAAGDKPSRSPEIGRHPHTGHLPVNTSQGAPHLVWAQATWVPVIKDQRARPHSSGPGPGPGPGPEEEGGQAGRRAGVWFESLELPLGTLALSWGCAGCLVGYPYRPPLRHSPGVPPTQKVELSAANSPCLGLVPLCRQATGRARWGAASSAPTQASSFGTPEGWGAVAGSHRGRSATWQRLAGRTSKVPFPHPGWIPTGPPLCPPTTRPSPPGSCLGPQAGLETR